MKALESTDSAIEWALKHIPGARDAYPKSRSDYAISLRQRKQDEVEEYVDFYHQTRRSGGAIIYRMICVPSINDIDWENLGTYWSYLPEGAASYWKNRDDCKDVLITARVSFDDINWNLGFSSFWDFGIEEAECAVKEGAELEIKAINHRPVIRWAKA